MSDRFSDNTSGNPASDLRSEDAGPTQGREQFDPTARSSRIGSQVGGHQLQDTSQSADPDFGRRDPPHGQSKSQTHFPGTREGQDYGQHGQQGQLERRQGGQTTGDNVYDGGDRDPRQDEYRTRQAVGGSQERFETSENYGTSTGTGPGARSGDNSIHGDGGFGGKPTMPERVIGITEKMVGKATGNVGMYEHGQERKTGGY